MFDEIIKIFNSLHKHLQFILKVDENDRQNFLNITAILTKESPLIYKKKRSLSGSKIS